MTDRLRPARFVPVALLIAFVALLTATPVAAAVPAKTEMTISGNYDRPKGGGSEWDLTGSFFFPAGNHFVLGPLFHFDQRDDDVDGTHAGVGFELNTGRNAGFFVGVHGTYLIDTDAEGDRHSVAGVGGIKWPWGGQKDPSEGGAFLKIEASYVVDGLGEDRGLGGLIGIGGRWGS